MNKHPSLKNIEISQDIIERWQSIVDILAEILDIPAALVMRIVGKDLEVFMSSKSKNNPYEPGEREPLEGSGLYCETVIKSRNKLLIPNALLDEKWKNNPDIKHNMISYLGFPVRWPNGMIFGTLCVLDNKANSYSDTFEQLMIKFREILENNLLLLFMNHELGVKNKNLSDYLAEIKSLREITPICSYCKKIKDDKGYWETVEAYFSKHTDTKFSHGLCPECLEKHYKDIIK